MLRTWFIYERISTSFIFICSAQKTAIPYTFLERLPDNKWDEKNVREEPKWIAIMMKIKALVFFCLLTLKKLHKTGKYDLLRINSDWLTTAGQTEQECMQFNHFI